MRLTPPQKAIIEFMRAGHATWIAFYLGEVGTDGRGSGLFFRKSRLDVPSPKLTYPTVAALLARGLLIEEDGEFKLTQAGKEVQI